MNYEAEIGVLNVKMSSHEEEIKILRKKSHDLANEQIVFSETLKASHDNLLSCIELQKKMSERISEIDNILLENKTKKEAVWSFFAKSKIVVTTITCIMAILYFAFESHNLHDFLGNLLIK